MYRIRSASLSQRLQCATQRPEKRLAKRPKKRLSRLPDKQRWKPVFSACVYAATLGFSVCTAVSADNAGWQRVGPAISATPSRVQNKPENTRPTGGASSADEWLDAAGTAHPDKQQAAGFAKTVTVQPSAPIDRTGTINLDLFVGQVSVLGQVDVNRVAVGNGGIINAQVIDTGELLVIAAAPGSSSLRLWHKDNSQTDYNIRVTPHDPETRVPLERMVRMRVRMVEFRKSALGRLGIDWNDSASGPVLATIGEATNNPLMRPQADGFQALSGASNPVSAYYGIASSIASKINFLAQNGDAVTLAEPVLSAMNGGKASFLAGGEVPYPSVADNGQTQVEFKEYGVKLNVAPLIDAAGNIRAVLETEISQLDSSVSVQGTPGLLTRRASTEVTVRSGETIVISGLLSSESSTDTDRVPGLGRLPILGSLFGSKSRLNAVNELVIFVTPEVIEPGQTMINARERLYLDASDGRVHNLRQQLPLME